MLEIKIFVSSPGDVALERVRAEKVIRSLNAEFAGHVKLKSFLWEHEPMRATASFDDPENIPEMSEFDVVVCILWSRLGTMLSRKRKQKNGEPWPSGTAYELVTATEFFKQYQAPDLLTYRKTEPIPLPLDNEVARRDKLSQYEALERFIKEWFFDSDSAFKVALTSYKTVAQFEDLLTKHLRRLVEEKLEKHRRAAGGAASDSATEQVYFAGNPYRGLASYDFPDEAVFFGRAQAIEEVVTMMRQQAAKGTSISLVHGMSGSGKSSLVRAGVAPVLMGDGVAEGIACWRRAVVVPGQGQGLLESLAQALLDDAALPRLESLGSNREQLVGLLNETHTGPLCERLNAALELHAREIAQVENLPATPKSALLLVIDQMEGILAEEQTASPAERAQFVKVLLGLSSAPLCPVWVIGTIRSDQMGALAEAYPELVKVTAQSGQYQLLPPSELDLGAMIRLPARAAGLTFEEHPVTRQPLEERLLKQARHDPDGLPLLSFVMEQLYLRRKIEGSHQVLTHAALDELGGIEGALEARAKELFPALTAQIPSGKDGEAAVFKRLARTLAAVSTDANTHPLRRVADAGKLRQEPWGEPFLKLFVDDGRLLTLGASGKMTTVSVSHEALLRRWKPLADAIARERAFLILRGRAASSAAYWLEAGKRPDMLWDRGQSLADARSLLVDRTDLDQPELDFCEASVHGASTGRILHSSLAGLALAIVAGGGWWLWKAKTVEGKAALLVQQRRDNFADLGAQLREALKVMHDQVWDAGKPDGVDDDDGDDYRRTHDDSIEDVPALAVAEISRRMLELQPQDREAIAASVEAAVMGASLKGDPEAAQKQIAQGFQRWKEAGLPDAELLNLKALAAWQDGDQKQAVSLWGDYLKGDAVEEPVRKQLYDRMSLYQLNQQAWREAELVLNEWLSFDGKNALPWARRAKVALEQLRLDRCQTDLAEARKLDPGLPELITITPEVEQAVRFKDQIDKISSELASEAAQKDPKKWLERCKVLLLAGRPGAALRDVESAAKRINGMSTAIEFIRAMCTYRQKRALPDNSAAEKITVWDLNAEEFQAFLDDDWAEILELLDLDLKILGGKPPPAQAVYDRAQKLLYFAQSKLATPDVDALFKDHADDLDVHELKARLFYRSRDWEKGLISIKASLEKFPEPGRLHFYQSECLIGTRQPEQAVQVATETITTLMKKMDPATARRNAFLVRDLLQSRARAYRALNRESDAEKDDQQANLIQNALEKQ